MFCHSGGGADAGRIGPIAAFGSRAVVRRALTGAVLLLACGTAHGLSAQDPTLPTQLPRPGQVPQRPDVLPYPRAPQDTLIGQQPRRVPIPVDTLHRDDDGLRYEMARDTAPAPPPVDEGALFGVPGLRVFGRELFTRATTQFQTMAAGPVDPGYRLGPGDQLLLVMAGDVDMAHTVEVTREGMIVVPQVGQLAVQGLTLRQTENLLFDRLSRLYSGVGRGSGAATQFSATLGRLRSNQVFLTGDVERPGAYQVSSAGTVFTALYAARGPGVNGSFRRIEVRRGGALVHTVDLYDYMLRGDASGDVRLEQGDIVFVPPAQRQVAVQGSVRRPAIYELREGEDFRHLLEFAGGLGAEAALGRVQIDRILPFGARRPGVSRVLVDVDVNDVLRRAPIGVEDRDVVQIFTVPTERRHRVVITGEVVHPGVYEWNPQSTLAGLLRRAEGLTEFAYTPRAHIYRLNTQDGSRTLLRVPLAGSGSLAPAGDVALQDADSVVVFSQAQLRNDEEVRIAGLVKAPGEYSFAQGMTVRDLILTAGGFAPGADQGGVELVRRADPLIRSDTLSRAYQVALAGDPRAAVPGENARPGLGRLQQAGEVPLWVPADEEIVLEPGDFVLVRRAPGFESARAVVVVGEVVVPGTYILERRRERLSEVIGRAGGVTDEAYLAGLRLLRDGTPVGTDPVRALQRPSGPHNVVLEAGDTIIVPRFDPTVTVEGAVLAHSRVLFRPNLTLDDYIANAGGYTHVADRGRVSVTYPDGSRATVRGSFLFRTRPRVTPGAVIHVPVRPEGGGTNWGDVITRTATVITSAVTMWVAIDRLRS